MTDSSDTKVLARLGVAVASPYITSEPPDTKWGQPSLSHYVFVIDGWSLQGRLIESVYLTVGNSRPEVPDLPKELQLELEAWEAASDEDLLGFEAQLD